VIKGRFYLLTINQLLLWLSWISAILFILRVIKDPQRQTGWLIAAIGVLLVAVAGFILYPRVCGWIGFGMWLAWIVIPTIAAQQASTAIQSERYGRAAIWSRIAAILHPFDDWPERARIWAIVAAGDRVGAEVTSDRLRLHRRTDTLLGRLTIGLTAAIEADWAGLLTWLKSHTKSHTQLQTQLHTQPQPQSEPGAVTPSSDTEQDINLIILYLQALGETGQVDRLVAECDRLAARLEASTIRPRTYRTWLFVFAYTGNLAAVDAFIASRLLDLPEAARDRWRSIARVHASLARDRDALPLLTERPLRLRIITRLRHSFRQLFRLPSPTLPPLSPLDPLPPSPQTPLTPETTDRLLKIERRFLEEVRYGFHRPLYFPLVTSLAIGLNCLVFALELVLGGSQNAFVLYALGAVVPAAILENGQTWRLLAGTFLHFGWLHLITNMCGLFVLGQLAERWLGTLRYTLVYLASGVGSMGLVVMTVALGLDDDLRFVVGASGAVMGIFGAIGAILWRGYQQDHALTARHNLQTVAILFVLQSGFDILNPQVCATCHLSGAAIGFVVAWCIAPIGLRLRQPQP
jgi:rhomboid protease GluP